MTSSQLSCLLELKRLSEKASEVASVRLTRNLRLSKPSVHRLLEGLKNMGFVEKEFYGEARLTREGDQLAMQMLSKINMLTETLKDGIVRPEKAYDAALVLLSGLQEESFSCFQTKNRE